MINITTSNISSMTLMGGMPIVVKSDAGSFVIHTPTLQEESMCIYNFNIFLGLCSEDLNILQSEIGVKVESRLQLVKAACNNGDDTSLAVLYGLNLCLQDFEYIDDSIRSGGISLDDEMFDYFCGVVSVATGCKKLKTFKDELYQKKKELSMSPDELEWERKRLAAEAKIARAKAKDEKGTSLSLAIASVVWEFHFSLKEIYSMNKYTLFFFNNQVGNISNYEVTKIAAGTGNLGKKIKHKYWTN